MKSAVAAVTRHGVPICYGVAAGTFALAFAAGHARARDQYRQGRRSVLPCRAVQVGSVTTGQRVQWSSHSGVVKYVGPVKFASGEWIGLELDEPKGLHDGTVFAESYYTCKPKHGVFCQLSHLQGTSGAPAAVAAPPVPMAQPTPVAAAAGTAVGAVAVGQKVSWKGNPGTVKFVGKTAFASEEMVGVELDTAKGMHNGSLFGKTYFSCQDKHGVFCKVAELGGSSAPAPAPAMAAAPAPVAAPPPTPVAAPVPTSMPVSVASPSSGVSVGQKVSWKGNPGTVKFVGKTAFASEEMVGVELDTATGMHNGSLFGKTYFSCQDKHGVFCKVAELGGSSAPAPAPAMAAAPAPVAAPPPTPVAAPVPASMPVSVASSGVSVGQKVSWKGNPGTVKFVGKTAFASEEMVGVELDTAKGMHNGSLFGKTYFSCQDKHGVFCKVAELGGSSAPAPAPAMAAAPAPVAAPPPTPVAAPVPTSMPVSVASSSSGVSIGQKVSWKGNPGTVKFVGKTAFASEEMVGVELDTAKGMHNGSLFGKTYFSCQDKHGVFCKVAELGGSSAPAPAPAMAAAPAPVAAPPPAPVAAPVPTSMPVSVASPSGGVSVGQKVDWKGNTGTVKFVGKVDFAAEEMVGIELDTPTGLHNGSLFGKTYFTCQDKHGVFCKASALGAGSSPSPAMPASVPAAAPAVAPPTPAAAPASMPAAPAVSGPVAVGQKVSWKGNPGIVKFVGKVDFAAEEMVGIELDTAKGMHNGSLFGKSYFSCQDKHGVFCKAAELGGSSSPAASPPVAATPPPPMPAAAPAPAPPAPVAAAPAAAAPVAKPPTPAPTPAPTPPPMPAMTGSAAPPPGGFAVGMKVSWKGHTGTVQYKGPVDFGVGNWFGIALDVAKGLHDGSVFGKSYFQCPMGHGILTQDRDLCVA